MDVFLGTILPFGFNKAGPPAFGQMWNITQNNALFALLGTTYVGDGQNTFGLPDLRGRAPISYGQGPTPSNYVPGQSDGVENVTLAAGKTSITWTWLCWRPSWARK